MSNNKVEIHMKKLREKYKCYKKCKNLIIQIL